MTAPALILTPYQRKRRLVAIRRANREILRPSYWFPYAIFFVVVAFAGYSFGFVHGVTYFAQEVDARFECQVKEADHGIR